MIMRKYWVTNRMIDIVTNHPEVSLETLEKFPNIRDRLRYLAKIYSYQSTIALTERDYKNCYDIFFSLTDDGTYLGQSKIGRAKQFIDDLKNSSNIIIQQMTKFDKM